MGFSFKGIKRSGVCQLILGSLCLIFGIFDRIYIYEYSWRAFHTQGVIAMWTGVWFIITGAIGYFPSSYHPDTERPKMGIINAYFGLSIVAALFAGVLLLCYSFGVTYITGGGISCTRYEYNCDYGRCGLKKVSDSKCKTSVGLGAMIIIFAVVEFCVSIWASVCCCMGYDCCSGGYTSPPQMVGQVVYLQTQDGSAAAYVMTQGPNGMPVAVPAMTGGPVNPVPNHAVGGQGYVIQNPQGATAATPTQQGVINSGYQQPGAKTTDAYSEPPPEYTP